MNKVNKEDVKEMIEGITPGLAFALQQIESEQAKELIDYAIDSLNAEYDKPQTVGTAIKGSFKFFTEIAEITETKIDDTIVAIVEPLLSNLDGDGRLGLIDWFRGIRRAKKARKQK